MIEKLPKNLNINIWIIKYENKNEPIEPEIVLLGLIFVNFGPLKIFPKTNPPISEKIHPNKIIKSKIFKWIIFEKIMKTKHNKKV